ncbi:MAG: hypothetical protein CL928_06275 [Deltaproteobacteria bacterium]|nr:hypothetical protein [Deltaproteobacteria bacterium]
MASEPRGRSHPDRYRRAQRPARARGGGERRLRRADRVFQPDPLLQTELQRARRQGAPFALIMLDLDHFKSINDTHGHLCGDAVLAAVGQRIRDILRNSDTKCRYGGEEFMVLLPDTPRPGALHVAESLRAQLAEVDVTWNGEKVPVTASVGLAMAMEKEVDPMPLIGRADAALYRAKHGGRNQVCETEIPEPPAAEPQAV